MKKKNSRIEKERKRFWILLLRRFFSSFLLSLCARTIDDDHGYNDDRMNSIFFCCCCCCLKYKKERKESKCWSFINNHPFALVKKMEKIKDIFWFLSFSFRWSMMRHKKNALRSIRKPSSFSDFETRKTIECHTCLLCIQNRSLMSFENNWFEKH